MSLESDILAILTVHAGLTALVPAASMYFATAPQNLAFPYIVVLPISMVPTLTMDNGQSGAGRLDNYRLQVSCFARTLRDANLIGEQARRALEAATVTKCMLTDRTTLRDDMPDAFGDALTFSCWHNSNS